MKSVATRLLTALACIACAVITSACGSGSGGEKVPAAVQANTVVGAVSVIENFAMPQLAKTRRIWIYLPADYAASSTRYPVLYLNDGQNLFDSATSYAGEWGIDESMMKMESEDPGLRAIIVGIDNGGAARENEYMPSGRAADYVDFIVKTLKPYIDSNYRTRAEREHTGIGGSSFGAYVALYAGFTYQDVFGKVAAFSNVTIYDGGALKNIIARAGRQQDMQIYMDVGALEGADMVASNQQAYQQLLEMGFDIERVRLVVDPQGLHNEVSWRRRFPSAWRWLNGR